jgi:large subunit ribosomal protein L6
MSRIGKNPIKLPDAVSFSVNGKLAKIKGKLGELTYEIPELIECKHENSSLQLTPLNDTKNAQALWGTAARRFMSMIKGVNEGFSINVELKGVGYRAQVQGNKVVLQLALSHDVEYLLPAGIEVKSAKPTNLTIMGACKQTVGQVAAEIRSYRKPEPYKGKGIIREGEFVFRKEGKKK